MAAVPQCAVLNARAPCLTADKHKLFLSRCIYGLSHTILLVQPEPYKDIQKFFFNYYFLRGGYLSQSNRTTATASLTRHEDVRRIAVIYRANFQLIDQTLNLPFFLLKWKTFHNSFCLTHVLK